MTAAATGRVGTSTRVDPQEIWCGERWPPGDAVVDAMVDTMVEQYFSEKEVDIIL